MSVEPSADATAAGRNSPCPCGSGKRFKDCCGGVLAPAPTPSPRATYRPSGTDWSGVSEARQSVLAAMMEKALASQRDGDVSAARQGYQQVLDEAPLTHDALHMLAIIELGFQRPGRAEYYMREASALRADYPAIQKNRDLIANAVQARKTDRSTATVTSARASGDGPAKVAAPTSVAGATLDRDATVRTPDTESVCHIIGLGTRAVDDDDEGWLVARLLELLQPLQRPTFWSTDAAQARLATSLSLPTRRLFAGADAFPRTGTLLVVGCAVDVDAWLGRSRLSRVILFCERGVDAEYAALASGLGSATGLAIEHVFRSESQRDRFGIPGRVCLSPVNLADAAPTRDPDARTGRFVVGSVAEREESLLPVYGARLWLDIAGADMRVLLRGANRLRHLLGAEAAIEIRSRQLESLRSFVQQVDCLIYPVRAPGDEGWGIDLFAAMALGVPVLCSAQSCYAGYIDHGVNGFVFRNEREAVAIACQLRDERSVAARVGAAGQAWARATFDDAALRRQYALLVPSPIARPSV